MRKIIFLVMLCLVTAYSKDVTNSVGMVFKEIPAGNLQTSNGNVPIKSFYMAETEVTQEQWIALVNVNVAHFKTGNLKMPMESVNWKDVQVFIKKLNAFEKTNTYRLPTEDEWNYVRGVGKNKWPCTNKSEDDPYFHNSFDLKCFSEFAVFNAKQPSPVKSKKPNAWGIYDLFGNVSEFIDSCKDQKCYDHFDLGGGWDAASGFDLWTSAGYVVDYFLLEKMKNGEQKPNISNFKMSSRGFRLVKDK